jgi:hypothetical protein
MAFEFGFDVLRMDLEQLDASEQEVQEEGMPAYELLASAGDVSAHIYLAQEDINWLLHAIEAAEAEAGARPGGPWEPQLPIMRGFFFHPRMQPSGIEVLAPGQLDEDDEPIEFWEIRFEDEDGNEVILRLSDTVLRGLLRQLREA